jgi:peptide/nickel transport system substrate-binding protein
MIIKVNKKYGAFLLTAALTLALFNGCAVETGEGTDTHENYEVGGVSGQTLTAGYAVDKVFSLNLDGSRSLNPISTTSSANMLVDQLVYDTLFEVDGNFEVSSRLVKSWETTDDGTTWLFTLDTTVPFQDGSTLSAQDAAYSVQRAQRTAFYGPRLSPIYGVSAMDSGLLMISLQYPDMQFPSRLVVPVVKNGTMNDDVPPGSGPYMYSEDRSRLEIFPEYPDADKLPIGTIYLKEFTDAGEIISAFEDSLVDLVLNDPTGANNLGYGGSNEVRYYTTTSMHYLGFNTYSYFLCYPEYRRALNYAVDRETIVRQAMYGNAEEATLPINPQSALYDSGLASSLSYDLGKSVQELASVDVTDHDMDGKLEYMVTGIPIEIHINFIVCSDSSAKLAAARIITEDLQSIGLTVELRELNWRDYSKALEEGDFDMYYGEVKLPADFDLTDLLSNDGSLNYGGFQDVGYEGAIAAYLAADEENRAISCNNMCAQIAQYATIIPVCFEKAEVITHRGVETGMTPNQYNIFNHITDWKIALDG